MTPEQAVALLSVEEWPPRRLEHWPPKEKNTWRPGMMLQGLIEAVMELPRPPGSPRAGQPYLAMYVRRLDTGRLVMWHGWHTAAEDVPAMRPAPGLLFTAYLRGVGAKDYADFKYLVTPYTTTTTAAGPAVSTPTPAGPAAPTPRAGRGGPALGPTSGAAVPGGAAAPDGPGGSGGPGGEAP